MNDDKASPRLCPIGAPIVPDYATKMWDRRGKAGSFKASAPNADEKQSSFAWHAVIAAFVVAVFGWGTGLYGPSVYLEVVSRTQGWSVAAVSGAITLHFLIGLVVIPTLPTLYRHLGIAIVTAASGVLMAIGIFGLSVARQIWQLYAFGLLTGIGWSGLGAAAVTAIVVPWFTAKRSLALGLAFNGGSVGGIVFSPLWVGLIDKFGFETATMLIGSVMIVGLTLLALSISRYKPESTNTRSESLHPSSLSHVASRDSAEEKNDGLVLTRSRAFVTLCLGMTLALFAQTGVVTHLVSVLTVSMGRRHAGLAAGAAGFAAVVGRLLVNWRSPAPSDWRYIASFSLLAQITGCLVLLLANDAHPAFLIVGVIFFGLGVGNAISGPPVIANEEFTGVNARRVVALIVAISQGAYAFAPAAFGVVRDAWSDQSMFLVAAVIQLLAIASYMWDAGRLKNKRVREA